MHTGHLLPTNPGHQAVLVLYAHTLERDAALRGPHQPRVARGDVMLQGPSRSSGGRLHARQVRVDGAELGLARQRPAVAHNAPQQHVDCAGVRLAILLQDVDRMPEVLRCPQAVSQPLQHTRMLTAHGMFASSNGPGHLLCMCHACVSVPTKTRTEDHSNCSGGS